MLVLVLTIVSVVEWAFEGNVGPLQSHLALDPRLRRLRPGLALITWPLAYPFGIGLFDVLAIFFFYYFGNEIERLLGRKKMAWFLAMVTVGLALLWVLLVEATAISNGTASSGLTLSTINQLELMVLLVFIAEYPHRRFFFNIPGWVIGAVIVGALRARLRRQPRVAAPAQLRPRPGTDRAGREVARAAVGGAPGAAAAGIARGRKPTRSRGAPKGGPNTVVAGPWQPREVPPVSRDQAALDALLDKISASGMDSLTDHEREQLHGAARPAASTSLTEAPPDGPPTPDRLTGFEDAAG